MTIGVLLALICSTKSCCPLSEKKFIFLCFLFPFLKWTSFCNCFSQISPSLNLTANGSSSVLVERSIPTVHKTDEQPKWDIGKSQEKSVMWSQVLRSLEQRGHLYSTSVVRQKGEGRNGLCMSTVRLEYHWYTIFWFLTLFYSPHNSILNSQDFSNY